MATAQAPFLAVPPRQSRKPTILHVSEATGWTGGLARMLELAEGLRDRGWGVVLACRPGSRIEDEAERLGLEHLTLPLRKDYDLVSSWALAREAARRGVAIVHAHHPRAHGVALGAKLLAGLSGPPPLLVVSRRVSYRVGGNPLSRWKYGARQVDAYVAVAGAVRDLLVDGGVAPGRVRVVPSGVDAALFAPRPSDPALLEELGIPAGAPLVVKLANAAPAKGIEPFLRAAASVARTHPGARFLLAGRDTTAVWVRSLVELLGLSERVLLAGFRSDIPRLLSCASVSVNAAVAGEALSGALRESLAMGVPVVASDLAGNAELVRDGRTGLTVPPGDGEALARAIRWTLDHRGEALALALAGRRLVLEEFTVERSIERTERLYLELLAGRRPS